MSAITKIEATVKTGNVSGAGNDSNVYLGIAGREFRLDSREDDYEQGSNRIYTLGQGSNVKNPAENDPRTPALNTAAVDSFPAYIRYEPVGDDDAPAWNFASAKIVVNGVLKYQVSFSGGVWMGELSGKMCYLKKV